jgi:hypothetical protein
MWDSIITGDVIAVGQMRKTQWTRLFVAGMLSLVDEV